MTLKHVFESGIISKIVCPVSFLKYISNSSSVHIWFKHCFLYFFKQTIKTFYNSERPDLKEHNNSYSNTLSVIE